MTRNENSARCHIPPPIFTEHFLYFAFVYHPNANIKQMLHKMFLPTYVVFSSKLGAFGVLVRPLKAVQTN